MGVSARMACGNRVLEQGLRRELIWLVRPAGRTLVTGVRGFDIDEPHIFRLIEMRNEPQEISLATHLQGTADAGRLA